PEKTPSFFVNDQKGFYHCFSSGKHGDQFRFLMETEGLSFRDAVERLASLAGVPVPAATPEEEKREARRKTLHEVVELAAKFFEESLQARTGARARGYLADRGLAPATIARFRIGYAPAERFALKEYLGAKSVPVEDMVEAGLLVAGDDIPLPYDRFRERVMFPIADFRGRIVAFGGRALDPDAPAKYLNSPETPLFRKGGLLYNGAAARAATQKGASLIVVEGYVDAIAMVSAGFEATVAPLGTALTEDQLILLWRMAEEPILCFDGDAAGRRAAYRAVDLALPLLVPGKSLRFASLPEGQDPDDLIKNGGADAMREVLGSARPLAEVLWLRESESANLETPERRAALEARLAEILRMIGDETVRRYYRDDLKDRLANLFQPNRAQFQSSPRFRGGPRRQGARMPEPASVLKPRSNRLAQSSIVRGRAAVPAREALILLAVLNHPWLLADHAEELAHLDFGHGDASTLRQALLDAAAAGAAGSAAELAAHLETVGAQALSQRMERSLSHGGDWEARPDAAREDVIAWWRQIVSLHRKKRTLSKELQEAERALGAEPTEANFAWLKDVQQRLAVLDGTETQFEGFGAPSGRPARSM
ncbi:MAG TPA: DNA primase, partial [Xanthobacteraceae bacterium]|nr:DNA primase [Xanthobacteraceae bacterium]